MHLSETKTVILAAGSSTRLGTNKLCLRVNGEAVIRITARFFVEMGMGDVIVVTGFEKEKVESELQGLPVRLVHNPNYPEGMSASVKAALPLISRAEAAFFHLGDKPFVERTTIDRMLDVYVNRLSSIIVPVYKGMRGHPVLMRLGPFLAEMGLVEGDAALKPVLERHEQEVFSVEGDEGTILDIDTEEDIDLLRRRGFSVEKG